MTLSCLKLPQRLALAVFAGCVVFAPMQLAQAQGNPDSGSAAPESGASAGSPGTEDVRGRIAELESETARVQTLAEQWEARSAEFAQAREGSPQTLAAIEVDLVQLRLREPTQIHVDLPSSELELELLGQEQEFDLARKLAVELEAETSLRAARRKQVPDLLAAARERLLSLGAETAAPASEPALAQARQRLSQTRRRSVSAEIAAYEEELRSFDVRGQLLALRRERAALRVAALDARVERLREALAARRQGEAELTAREAELSFELEHPETMPPAVLKLMRGLAAENRELAQRRTGPDGLLQKIEETSSKLVRAEQQLAAVSADLELLQRNVEAAGLSGSVGLLLRRVQSDVPDARLYRRFIRMRRDQISEAQVAQIELVDRRRALDDVVAVVERKLTELEPAVTLEDRVIVETPLRDLLETQRVYLDTLIADTESHFQKLVDFDARQRELVSRSQALKRFIDERVLWIPSGEPIPPTLSTDLQGGLAWLMTPRYWGQLLPALVSWFERTPLSFVGTWLLLLVLPFASPRIRSQIVRFGEQAGDPRCISMAPTAGAMLLSLLLALWAPVLLGFLGWHLSVSVSATQFVRCVSTAIMAASFVWATLQIPRQLLRPGGIAVAHLGWPEAPSRDLRRKIRWLTALVIPAVFVIALFEVRAEEAWKESLGRLASLLLMAALFVFNHRILRGDEGADLRRIERARSEFSVPSWAWRAVRTSALIAVFGLAAAAVRGYYWTSLQLAASTHVTLIFLFLVVFGYLLGSRWLLLASRRLALQRWQKAVAERRERRVQDEDNPPAELEEPEVDLATIDAQTGRLLRIGALLAAGIGVWVIWADLLPAAGALRAIELWQTHTVATVEIVDAAGENISSVEERLVAITLADLLLALVVAAATLALARNLPGLLEISLFRRLQTSAGERYAYATIGKYAVTIIGTSAALSVVGIGWSSIQWMIAAVGIGLGFGLQEIFANFISGLIILFERPIRVGDTVTVGDVSGTVTKIRIRATWITGFDRKELVVPNKEFITGRLVNWSLSDGTLRVDIPVGIAYGSDTRKAQRVLEEVARANPNVMTEPAPFALFRGFGESSLDFELRAFSPDVSHYVKIVHELHMEIDRAFRAEGIEIAFPQRDLHVRTLPLAVPAMPGGPPN